MRKNFLFRFVTFYSSFTILLQSFLPFAYITPQIAFSQDSTQTSIEETVTPTTEPTNSPTAEPTISVEPTSTPTAEPTSAAVVPTEEAPTTIPQPTTLVEPTASVTPATSPTVSPTPNETVSPTGQILDGISTSVTPSAEPSVTVTPTTATLLPDEVVKAEIVKLDGSYADPNLVPATWTDKLDYHPTEKVVVSGKNFIAGQTYTITISSNDNPAVTHSGTFVALNDGTFTYEYQLDGNYRPNYSVEIKDASGTVVATTTFTDSASSTTTISNTTCFGDLPGQNGTVCTANDISLASVSGITIIGHGCRFPGDTVQFSANWQIQSSATSRYDVGLWFATAGQTSALHGANSCSATSLPSSPSPFFDAGGSSTCGDIHSGSTGNLSITMTATCNPDSSGFLKMPYCTTWDNNSPNNNQSQCTSPTNTLPGTGSKCNCQDGFTVPIAVPPSIEVVKSLSPANDSGKFDLQVNGTTYATNVGDGGATGKQTAVVGSNTIGELAGTGTNLSDYSKSVVCKANHGAGSVVNNTGSNPWTITATNGQDILCTITNTRINNGSITIIKDAVPNDAQDFAFTTTGTGLSGFSLDDDADGTLSNTKVFSNLGSGTYSVAETAVNGWTQTSATCTDGSPVSAIALSSGENVTCTFTNTKQPKLTVTKVVTDNNGGTAVVADFPLFVDGGPVVSGAQNTFSIGSHTVTEVGNSQYVGTFSGDCDVNGNVTLAAGDSKVCTLTNDDKKPTLTLVKTVTTDNGGTAVAADWTLTATGPTSISGAGGTTSDSSFAAGTYTLSESAGPTGYTAGSWSCVKNNNAPVTGSSISLALGDSATCTINNDDQPATLTVVKNLNKQYGGTLNCNDFSFSVNGTPSVAFEADCSNTITVNKGTYSVTEDAVTGYTPSYSNCTNVVLGNGGSATCTVTNDDQPATLIVKKIVINDNGGTKIASDFTFKVNGGADTTFTNTTTPDGEVTLTVNNGTYSVVENADTQYSTTYDKCSNITIPNGGTATCTITNNDIQPKLTVTKIVTNDNGGTKVVADFPLFVNATGVVSGVQNGFNAGTYTVSETGLVTYASAISGDCATDGSITLALGDVKSCTITNDDIKPQLHLRKIVVNDNGGSAEATDWTLTANGATSISGTTPVDSLNSFEAGTYSLSESGPTGYTPSDWVCNGGTQDGSSITVGLGDDVTCTITNDDQQAYIIVNKTVTNNNGGTAAANDFNLSVDGNAVLDEVAYAVNPGIHTASETNLTGYQAGSWGGDCNTNGNVTVALGQTKTCTITNNDIPPSLTLVKVVDNLHGGTAIATDWTLTATGPATISGPGGATSDSTFSAGTYVLSESTGPTGYTAGSWSCDGGNQDGSSITLGLGETATCTVYNADQPATLFVKKHVINDNGGTLTANDFTLSVSGNEAAPNSFNGSEDGVEVTLDAGAYSVDETTVAGYAKSLSEDCEGQIGVGETKICTVTNDDTFGKVVVTKFNDLNGNGTQDKDEPTLPDWDITLSDFANQQTNGNGVAEFAPVIPGDYTVGEVQQSGWQQTGISCTAATPTPTVTPTGGPTPTEGPTPTAQPTPVSSKMDICHYNASSSRWNAIQISASAWATHLTHGDALHKDYPYGGPLAPNGHPAPHTGEQWCRDNNPLELSKSFGVEAVNAQVSEDLISTTKDITVGNGETVECTIGNQHITPELTIAKFNDTWPNDKAPGSEVNYTLKLKISKNDIKDLLVVDLPANGIKYKSGSWSATKNGLPFAISEPQYHSPGKWELGDVAVDDEIVLSYTATIDSAQKPGLYKDLAWAYGCEFSEDCSTTSSDKLLASSVDAGTVDPGVVTEQFVGTKVAINKETQNSASTNIKKEETRTGEVLGASTSLPSTGASTFWLYVMSLLSGFGIISILMGLFMNKKLGKKLMLFTSVFIMSIALFVVPQGAHAATGDVSIRISEPKTPINQTFDLIFVTLDMLDRPITVKCFKKAPSEGSYSQFGPDIALISGGNSNKCDITDSLLSQKGTYNFYTTADAGDGPVQSQIVAVDYNNSEGPGTPTNYAKDHISSCQNKISFKTSDDSGKTVKVEIYRSENTSFAVDSSNRITTVSIGSNTDGSYTDNVPDCNKAYYYVIRAFDTFGNGSGIIGDSIVTVTSTSSTTTTTSTTTSGSTGAGAIPVAGGSNIANEAEVLGVQTFITPGASDSGRVLGEKTENQKSTLGKVLGAVTNKNIRPWYIAAVALAIGILGYVIYRKRKQV